MCDGNVCHVDLKSEPLVCLPLRSVRKLVAAARFNKPKHRIHIELSCESNNVPNVNIAIVTFTYVDPCED